MRTLLLFLAISAVYGGSTTGPQAASAKGCESVYCDYPTSEFGPLELVDGECRGKVAEDDLTRIDAAGKEAAAKCAQIIGKPIIIHNQEQETYWRKRVPQTWEGHVILGIVCNATTSAYHWTDGSTIDFRPHRYDPQLDEPCKEGFNGGIAWYLYYDGAWESVLPEGYKTIQTVYFCSTKQLEPPVVEETVYCDYPISEYGPLELVDGECRGKVAEDDLTRIDAAGKEAAAKCAQIIGTPIIIHNQEQESYWKKRVPQTWEGYVILGIVCNATTSAYHWTDGSAIDFKPHRYDPRMNHYELDEPCKEGFNGGIAWYLYNDGAWESVLPEGYKTIQTVYFCSTIHLDETATECINDFTADLENGGCYKVKVNAASWEHASRTCKNYGADLASIHNENENVFIRRLAEYEGVTNKGLVFIGASAHDNETFLWTDGSKMDYENYAPRFPKNYSGKYVAMDTSSGQWINVDCSARLPFVCLRASSTVTAKAQATTENGAFADPKDLTTTSATSALTALASLVVVGANLLIL